MIPFKAARKIEHTPVVTYLLIAINVLVFLWQMTLSETDLYTLYFRSGFVPCAGQASFAGAFTSMFLHGGFLHLAGNMIFLLAFGPAVEDYLGKFWYGAFYIAAGLAGAFLHMLFTWNVCIPAIGASGAISGVMGGFLLLYPGTRIKTVAFFWGIPVGIRDVRSLYILGWFLIVELLNGIATLGPKTAETGGVAVWAHVGGFALGFLMAFIAMTFKPLPPVDPIYLDGD
ncbi:MAG TPA: rhomboid family intramembrane serine protease [Phototrophicaceae bacterium]|nr:rhomboid family intramembrane serine protease [Phototrophicaceae bacterium]